MIGARSMLGLGVLAGPLPTGGVDLPPDDARGRIRRELLKPEYDDSPGFVQWVLGAIERWLTTMLDGISGSSPAHWVVAVIVGLALLTAAVLVLRRSGMLRRSAELSVASDLDADPVQTAAQLRRRASDAASGERWDDAVVLAMRALVRDLDERTLVDVVAGMTAHEAAAAAREYFPELSSPLQKIADDFDTAAYSRSSVGAKSARDAVKLAEYLAQTSPTLTDDSVSAFSGVAT